MVAINEILKENVLNERFISVGINPKDEKYREKYRDQLITMLQNSYKGINGYGGISDKDEELKSINNDISNSVDSLDNDTQNKNVTILISPKKKQFSPKNIHFRDRVEETYNLTRPIPIKDTINTMEIPKIINLTVNNIKLVLDDKSITDKKTDEIIENNNDELDGFELL
jgi:hypothetical protein